jgi:hypothetical protein
VFALAELAFPAVANQEGADKVLEPLRQAPALCLLRGLLTVQGSTGHRASAHAMLCLARLIRSGTWPDVDSELAADLTRFLVIGNKVEVEGVASLVSALASDRTRLVHLGDVRSLQRALASKQSVDVAAVAKVLQTVGICDACGVVASRQPLLCSGCRKVSYCSRDCQKVAWRSHKTACGGLAGRS